VRPWWLGQCAADFLRLGNGAARSATQAIAAKAIFDFLNIYQLHVSAAAPVPWRSVTQDAAASAASRSIGSEIRCVHKTDLGHAIALCRRQHLGYHAILGATIGAQMNLRLRILEPFRPEAAIQLVEIDHQAIPDDGAVEIDFQIVISARSGGG
jgi:hypothetical protein